jgi:hypothetical protein
MDVRGSLATALLLMVSMSGCAAPTAEDGAPAEAHTVEEPLDMTIDSLDVVHGALRLSVTMVDGAADVSVRLAGPCEKREVGGGLATRSTLVWTLGDGDLADAIRCGLLLRARVRDGTRAVDRIAGLGVAVDVSAAEGENANDGPQLQAVSTSELGVSLVFTQVTRSARLTAGNSILEDSPPESDEDASSPSDGTGQFTVPPVDFARSILGGMRLHLDGSSLVASLSLGGVSLETEEPSEEVVAVEAQESDGVTADSDDGELPDQDTR